MPTATLVCRRRSRSRAAAVPRRAPRPVLVAAFLATVVLHASCSRRDDAPAASPSSAVRPYSVQMHVHGSFSEGVGSIDSHSWEATDVGADVIWWSDHDFRITSYGHASTFGFEDFTEPLPPDRTTRLPRRRQKKHVKQLIPVPFGEVAPGKAEFVTQDPREGAKSLRLTSTSDTPDFAAYRFMVVSDRSLLKRPLASDVTLDLSVFPEKTSADARVVVEIGMSEHPPREGLPFETYHLRYVLDDATTEPHRDGTTFVVPVPFRAGEWNDLALPVSRDAVRGFPFIQGEDNSLNMIIVGVETRKGATAVARFDDLRILQEISGPQAFTRQGKLIDAVARDYPKLHELQGVEVSWVGHHLNEFSVATRPVDYDALGRDAPPDEKPLAYRDRVTRRVVEEIHARGGLVSYNHMYGTMMEGSVAHETREQMLDELLAQRVFGADILEVGYRDRGGHPMKDHLWVWDQLGLNGLFLVGTGVSDSHGGPNQRWRTDDNNFLSWIYARSPTKADLIEGLRAGRVFFGDIVLFNGTVDLTTARGARMGQIVVTDAKSEDVTVAIHGLIAGDVVHLLASGEEVARWTAEGKDFAKTERVALDPERPTIVRAEVYAPNERAKVLCNPITFVRNEPPGGIPATRAVHEAAAKS